MSKDQDGPSAKRQKRTKKPRYDCYRTGHTNDRCKFNGDPLELDSRLNSDDEWIGCDCCSRFYHMPCVDILDPDEASDWQCPLCFEENRDKLLKEVAKKIGLGTKLPLQTLRHLVEAANAWEPWDTKPPEKGDCRMPAGYVREQTESYNWYNVGRFLLSKKLNPWVVPGKAPPEGATSLVVLDSVDKDRKRVLGNLLKEKWRNLAKKVGAPRSGHGDEDDDNFIPATQVVGPEQDQEFAAHYITNGYRKFLNYTKDEQQTREAVKQYNNTFAAALASARSAAVAGSADKARKIDSLAAKFKKGASGGSEDGEEESEEENEVKAEDRAGKKKKEKRRSSGRREFLEHLDAGTERAQAADKARLDILTQMYHQDEVRQQAQDDFNKRFMALKEKEKKLDALKFLLTLSPNDQALLAEYRKLALE